MDRHELQEFYYITPIGNVSSILQHGILSHSRASAHPHGSVAMQEVQNRRAQVTVPGGLKLHEYANLYICARNPMLFTLQSQHERLCVLAVDTSVLDLSGVVITDSNASSKYVRFSAAPQGLRIVSREQTFAEDWRDTDRIEYFRKKAAKCAEVLVPECIQPHHLLKVYVSCEQARGTLSSSGTGLEIVIDRHMFFFGGEEI